MSAGRPSRGALLLGGLGGGGPAAGLVLEDQGIEEGLGGLLLVLVELADGLELEPEVLVGAPLAVLEEEGVPGDLEGLGELAEDLEGGLGGAGLVAVDLDEGEVDQPGQGLLGEAAGLAGGYIPVNQEAE